MDEGEPAYPLLSVLVPAYNEEAGLELCIDMLVAKLRGLDIRAEIMIVDDCSSDRTADVADQLAKTHACVRAFHHPINRGIGGGLLTGISHARGEWLILIPADLALDLDELPKYLDAAPQADIVVGISSDRRDYSFFRRLVSWTNIHLIRSLFGTEQRQFNYISMYRLDLLRQIRIEYWKSAFFFAEIIIKCRALGGRLVEAEIRYVPRTSGRATGAKPNLIARTVLDMLRMRLRGARTVGSAEADIAT